MNVANLLAKTGLVGRVLFVGQAEQASSLAEKLGLREVYVADTNHEALERKAKSDGGVKVLPVYTRVIERFVDLPSSSLDAVVSFYALEKALNKRAFMTEARRVLRAGGKLVIACKLKTFLRKKGLGKKDLKKLLEVDGFTVESKNLSWDEAFIVLVKSGSQQGG
ncbi:MAG: methyltransferase domain-containing protein [Candidatus Caldarchaeum sp.]